MEQIRYHNDGTRSYYIDGKECSESVFWLRPNADLLTEMLAEQRAPHGISDCTFMKDTANGKQFAGQEHIGNAYRETAESMGASVTGKKYVSGLAAFPGDPEAWVDSRGDVERVLAKRGWGSEGTINVKSRQPANPHQPGPVIAEDLLDKYTNQIADADDRPELVDRADLKEQVRERLAPPKHLKESKKKKVAA